MKIGELARVTGVSTRALRFYEENGLLESDRLANGYRVYPDTAVARVRNIRNLLDHGLTLEDVAHFSSCLDGDVMSANPDPQLVAVARRRLAVLDERIEALVQVRDQLAEALTSGR
ncbi:MerR family transcriptional regulator [Saccharothrix sp.]|uniref:MerR family transcriptional regulator n=1 Tax=Saccharothrix sp. TaxID=1873460 RepID=UPI0028124461|nr:MerR family transcriptional regulator [Saccharothrix sp.]